MDTQTPMSYCTNCGTPLNSPVSFCHKCGAELHTACAHSNRAVHDGARATPETPHFERMSCPSCNMIQDLSFVYDTLSFQGCNNCEKVIVLCPACSKICCNPQGYECPSCGFYLIWNFHLFELEGCFENPKATPFMPSAELSGRLNELMEPGRFSDHIVEWQSFSGYMNSLAEAEENCWKLETAQRRKDKSFLPLTMMLAPLLVAQVIARIIELLYGGDDSYEGHNLNALLKDYVAGLKGCISYLYMSTQRPVILQRVRALNYAMIVGGMSCQGRSPDISGRMLQICKAHYTEELWPLSIHYYAKWSKDNGMRMDDSEYYIEMLRTLGSVLVEYSETIKDAESGVGTSGSILISGRKHREIADDVYKTSV